MRYIVDYMDDSEDLCHVWLDADDAESAKAEALREYWDIKEIIDVHPSE